MNSRSGYLSISVVILSAGLVVCSRSDSDHDAAPPPAVEEGYFAGDDSVRLFYRLVGGPGDTVVVVHGGPGNDSAYLLPDLEPLTRTHTVLAYDQRGGGRSELPADSGRLTIAHHVRDLERLRQRFRIERMTLLAHSFGPLLAAFYAVEYPEHVDRMILIGPVPPRRGELWERFEANVARVLEPEELERMEEIWKELETGPDPVAACRAFWEIALKPRFADPTRIGELRGDLCSAPAEAIRYGMTRTNPATVASVGAWDLTADLGHVGCPVLIIHGEAEPIPMDLVEEWTTALPNARLLRVPDAAHFPYVEQPAIVWPAIERFLGGSWPDAVGGGNAVR